MASQNTTLDDIAAVIGFSATVRLSAWFSNGSSLYVPETPTEECLLSRLIGQAAAERLSKEWPKELLWIPTMSGYEDMRRRRQICRMLEQGFGSKEVARTIGMSEKRILQITRELEAQGFLPPIAPEKKPLENDRAKTPTEIGWGNFLQKEGVKISTEEGSDFQPQAADDDGLVDRD